MAAIAHDSAYLDSLAPLQLYGELALAAHRLANKQLSPASRSGWPAICRECGQKHPSELLGILHAEGCLTGSVVRVLVALGRAELYQAFERSTTPRKETAATPNRAMEAAARETRPQPNTTQSAAEGAYGEPWEMDGTGAVHNRDGITMAEPVGCDLVEPDDASVMRRIVACVNYCNGVATEDLEMVGGVQ